MVVFGYNWLYSEKGGFIPARWLSLDKSGCIRAKVDVFGQKWMYSGKSGCIQTKMVVFR